jgi:hypothetical protein
MWEEAYMDKFVYLQAGATYTYEKLNKDDLWGDLNASFDLAATHLYVTSYAHTGTQTLSNATILWNGGTAIERRT